MCLCVLGAKKSAIQRTGIFRLVTPVFRLVVSDEILYAALLSFSKTCTYVSSIFFFLTTYLKSGVSKNQNENVHVCHTFGGDLGVYAQIVVVTTCHENTTVRHRTCTSESTKGGHYVGRGDHIECGNIDRN